MTAAEYAMYETLAENNLGTIISGHCCVDPLGRANPEQVNIYADSFTDQFRKAVAIAHAHDARFIAQISHAGPRAIDNEDLADVVARPLKKGRHARADGGGDPSHRAVLHRSGEAPAVGRLRWRPTPCRPLVPALALHRPDVQPARGCVWRHHREPLPHGGGDHPRHPRGLRQRLPVLIKVNVDTKAEDAEGYHRDMVWLLQRAKALGVELVEFSGVDFINLPKTATLYYLPQVKRLRAEVPDIPLSLVGGVRSLADMEAVIKAGIECVSLGRSLIAEPDFVTKELAGGEKSICVSCSRCFVLPHMHPGIRCVWAWKKERACQKQAAIQK